MEPRPGLRERKKQQTRRLLAETAQRLFAERGFDAVTVVDIAHEADVSPGTVFNYFPTKESLFYEGMVVFEAALVEAVRSRPAGQTPAAAFRRVMLDGSERLALDEAAALIAEAARVVAASPALQAREREVVADATAALAGALREEGAYAAAGTTPEVAAHALMGVQRALVAWVREQVAAGRRGPSLVAGARAEIDAGFALLDRGLR